MARNRSDLVLERVRHLVPLLVLGLLGALARLRGGPRVFRRLGRLVRLLELRRERLKLRRMSNLPENQFKISKKKAILSHLYKACHFFASKSHCLTVS